MRRFSTKCDGPPLNEGDLMAISHQFFTLAGVAVGAVSSYLVSTLTERTRHRWEVATGWRGKKLEA